MQQEHRGGGTIKITKCYIFFFGGGRLKMKQDAINNSKRSPELVSIGL